MKRNIYLLILLIMFSYSFLTGMNVVITLHDGEVVSGNLVGKMGENIFVVVNDMNVTFHREIVSQIRNHDRVITEIVFTRENWIEPYYSTSLFLPFREGITDLEVNEGLFDVPQMRTDEMIMMAFEDPFLQIQTNTINEGDEIKPQTKKDVFWGRIAAVTAWVIIIAAFLFEVF